MLRDTGKFACYTVLFAVFHIIKWKRGTDRSATHLFHFYALYLVPNRFSNLAVCHFTFYCYKIFNFLLHEIVPHQYLLNYQLYHQFLCEENKNEITGGYCTYILRYSHAFCFKLYRIHFLRFFLNRRDGILCINHVLTFYNQNFTIIRARTTKRGKRRFHSR